MEEEGQFISFSQEAAKSQSSDTAGHPARTTSDPRGLLSGGVSGTPERTVPLVSWEGTLEKGDQITLRRE